MGRLITTNSSSNVSTLSGSTNMDVHVFIDKSGNVTQIKKSEKTRLKYFIDPVLPPDSIIKICAIGIGDPFADDCTEGAALGIGDNTIANANYQS